LPTGRAWPRRRRGLVSTKPSPRSAASLPGSSLTSRGDGSQPTGTITMPAAPADTAQVWTRRVSKPGQCRIRPTLDRQRTGRLIDHQRRERHEPRRISPEPSTGVPQPHHRTGRPCATSSHHGARSSNVVTSAGQTPISTRTCRRPQAGLVRRPAADPDRIELAGLPRPLLLQRPSGLGDDAFLVVDTEGATDLIIVNR
jgi:hypothetical protein